MDVRGSDLGAACERDADDVCDVAGHELPSDHPAFALCDRRPGPDGGHFRQAVDLELRDSEIDPGPLHEAKALDPIPRPDELRLNHGQIASHDQERHPGPFALNRLREGLVKLLGAGVFSEDAGTDRDVRDRQALRGLSADRGTLKTSDRLLNDDLPSPGIEVVERDLPDKHGGAWLPSESFQPCLQLPKQGFGVRAT